MPNGEHVWEPWPTLLKCANDSPPSGARLERIDDGEWRGFVLVMRSHRWVHPQLYYHITEHWGAAVHIHEPIEARVGKIDYPLFAYKEELIPGGEGELYKVVAGARWLRKHEDEVVLEK